MATIECFALGAWLGYFGGVRQLSGLRRTAQQLGNILALRENK